MFLRYQVESLIPYLFKTKTWCDIQLKPLDKSAIMQAGLKMNINSQRLTYHFAPVVYKPGEAKALNFTTRPTRAHNELRPDAHLA